MLGERIWGDKKLVICSTNLDTNKRLNENLLAIKVQLRY